MANGSPRNGRPPRPPQGIPLQEIVEHTWPQFSWEIDDPGDGVRRLTVTITDIPNATIHKYHMPFSPENAEKVGRQLMAPRVHVPGSGEFPETS